MAGETEDIRTAFGQALASALSGIAVWWPNANFNTKTKSEFVEVSAGRLGGGSGRRGERNTTWDCQVFCCVKPTTNKARAAEIGELVRAAVEDADIAVGSNGLLRLGKPEVDEPLEVEDMQVVVVTVDGRYQRA